MTGEMMGKSNFDIIIEDEGLVGISELSVFYIHKIMWGSWFIKVPHSINWLIALFLTYSKG